MDNGLGKNDPYRNMETGGDSIRPDFLKGIGAKRSGTSGASGIKSKTNQAAEDLQSKENQAGERQNGLSGDGIDDVRQNEAKAGGLWKGQGRGKESDQKGGKLGKLKGFFKSPAALLPAGIIIVVVAVLGIMTVPPLLLGQMDLNLFKSLGFERTMSIIIEQGKHIVGEMLSEGEVPDRLAGDLAAHGIEVGQVTVAGDFVRTNLYIADLDRDRSVAATDNYRDSEAEGELVIRFKDRIIDAGSFVAAVNSDPELLEEYDEAADLPARYYYSDAVNKVFSEEMNISRNNFGGWQSSSDSEENQKNFESILANALDKNTNLEVGGCASGSKEEDNYCETSSMSGTDSQQIISTVAGNTTGGEATARAAQLMNAAISAAEPYKAASTFVAIEEVLQRARIGDNGPVNEMMKLLNKSTKTSYVDVNTGEAVEKETSVLSSVNFTAAVSGGSYSRTEANNFSRDRILRETNMDDGGIISNTTLETSGQTKSNVVIGIEAGGEPASVSELEKINNSVAIGVTQKNSELFPSVVGGNRGVEGGLFLRDKIDQRVLGSMPSDAGTILTYNYETEELLARKARADRAVRSPFDISSPNTFLGSIVNSGMSWMLRNYSGINRGGVVVPATQIVTGLTGSSIKNLLGSAIADGNEDDLAMLNGDNCKTVKLAANVEGDIYCTEHTTSTTKYMSNTKDDWKQVLGSALDDSGRIKEEGELGELILVGKNRLATVGIKSAESCEQYRKLNPNKFNGVVDAIAGFFGIYSSCSGDEFKDVANGAKYTLSEDNSNKENVELYSGYMLYDTVYSLLSEKKSAVSLFEEEYYAKYPRDNSPAGRIASISGMTKEEAQIALDYAGYLNFIANYDASERYAFGDLKLEVKKERRFDSENWLNGDGLLLAGIAYRSERNRNFAAG